MQGVADTIGVSVSTVSRVFSSSEFASENTRNRVISAANRLGYTRHSISCPENYWGGDSRKMGTVDNIILLAPESLLDKLESSHDSWIYRDVIPTLNHAARKNGFRLILSSYGSDNQWAPTAMSSRHISGVLWMAHDRTELLTSISKMVPVVVLNDDSLWPPQTSVVSSNRMVIFKAVSHLVELGHKRIAYFYTDNDLNNLSVHVRERLESHREAITHFGLDRNPDLVIGEQFAENEHSQGVVRGLNRILEADPLPTALISSLSSAIQFLKETRKRSINIPHDLSIVAIDNAHAAELVDPSLTVVDCAFGTCAEMAIELLLKKKKSHHGYAESILVEPKLIIRNSTARIKGNGT
jgi:LacI family transcriptional regulator